MLTGKIKLAFAVICIFISATTAAAQTVTQTLDKASSVVRFSVDSQMMKISGQLLSYTGLLRLDKKTGVPQNVALKLDVSNIHIDPNNNFQTISIDSLFKTINNPIFTFESSKITPINKNQYKVEGQLKRGKQSWNSSMVLKSVLLKKDSTECYFNQSGPIKVMEKEVPFLALGGNQLSGSIESKLVFR